MNDAGESALGLEDFFGVRFGFGLGNDLFQYALFIDDERGAVRAIVFAPHELFGTPNPIGVMHAQIFVAQQVKLEAQTCR